MTHLHKILVVGTGSIGERHVRCFLVTGRATVAICEPNAAIRQIVNDRYDIRNDYGNLEEAMASRFDAAVIATPAPLHIPQAMVLARQQSHLLIEKPLSLDQTGIEELQKIIATNHQVVGIGYNWRAMPGLAAIRDALIRGTLGRPVQIRVVCGQHFPTYRPAYRETYYRDRTQGGGAIQDALTHAINAGEWLVGPIDRLVADCDHQVLPGVEVEDTVHVIARHGSVMGAYLFNQHQAPNELTVTLVGDRATARFEAHKSRWQIMTEPDTSWDIHKLQTEDRDALYVRQAQHFLDAIEGRGQPLCSFEQGIQTLRTNLAVIAACDCGSGWMKVDKDQ